MAQDMSELRQRYERLNGFRPAKQAYLQRLQRDLGLSLPDDFLAAVEFFDGSGIAVLPLHAISDRTKPNVLDETKRIRAAVSLPDMYLVLGEPPESMLLMDCSANGQVVWCDAIDVPRLGKEELTTPAETWHSFADFFAHLLDEEQRDRG